MSASVKIFLWILVCLCVVVAGFGGAVWLHDAFTYTHADQVARHQLGKDSKADWPIGAFIFCFALLGAICIGLLAAIMESIGLLLHKR